MRTFSQWKNELFNAGRPIQDGTCMSSLDLEIPFETKTKLNKCGNTDASVADVVPDKPRDAACQACKPSGKASRRIQTNVGDEMNLYVVPNKLRDALYKIVDNAIDIVPKMKAHREDLYKTALSFYNDNGTLPSFKITKSED